jgi:hypothetical protein
MEQWNGGMMKNRKAKPQRGVILIGKNVGRGFGGAAHRNMNWYCW